MLLVGASAFGQGWQDAYLFSQNEYGGTARSAALGNAVTALGGDPGTIGINPAGSSVNNYSQFMFTSGLSFANGWSVGTIAEGDTYPVGFGDETKSLYTRYKVPNVGFIFNSDTGRRHGLKRISFGFVMNSTADYTGRLNAAGVNSNNAFGAFLGSYADGFLTDVMANEAWDYVGDLTRMPPWIAMTAYRSGMISGVTGADGAYISLSEVLDDDGNFRLAAPVYQKYGRQTSGWKNDWVLNFSANWEDKFFLGGNLGITSVRYKMVEYWEESPEVYSEFPAINYSDGTSTNFESMLMKRKYLMEGSGVYAKAGFIWVPVSGVRIGGAVQTPTIMNVTERYGYTGQTFLTGKNREAVSSPEDYWGYDMVYPFRYNFGAAVTLGNFAILSADYEGVNYAQSRFRVPTDDEFDGYDPGMFDGQNQDIRAILGTSHSLRAGVEFRPMPGIALRTGYNYITSGIRDGSEAAKQIVSFGLGYSSSGSFYADCAVRLRFLPDEYVIPYYYYYSPNPAEYYNKEIDNSVMTPEIRYQSTVTEAVVTLGWRF
jgi:hypothetical protein